jgi:hypothetical protein
MRRRCRDCGAPFYDLRRSPIVCPKCGSKYAPTPPSRRLRPTPTGTEIEPAVAEARAADVEAADDGDDVDKDDDDDADQEDGDETNGEAREPPAGTAG